MSKGFAFFAAHGAPPAPPPSLDAYTSGMFAACWLSRLLSAYAGHAILVRRSSDNTTANIDFLVGGGLDTTTLLAFAGAGSAFVVTVYDQSGNGNNYTQATAANQPRIVNSGVFDAHMIYDGTNDSFVCVNNHGTPSGISLYSKLKLLSTATQQVIMISDAGNVSAGSAVWDYQNTTGGFRNIQATQAGANLVFGTYTSPPSGTLAVHGVISDFTQSASASRLQYYYEGTGQAGSFTTAGTISTATLMGAVPWCIGARADSSAPTNMQQNGFVQYEVAHNSTTEAAISTILDNY